MNGVERRITTHLVRLAQFSAVVCCGVLVDWGSSVVLSCTAASVVTDRHFAALFPLTEFSSNALSGCSSTFESMG